MISVMGKIIKLLAGMTTRPVAIVRVMDVIKLLVNKKFI